MGVGRNTTTPAARPPARPVIGLGGASARPGEREGPRGRRAAQAGRGERAGRSRRGAGAWVPGIAERAWGEAGRAIGGGGSPAGSAPSGESSGPAAVRRALGAAGPRVPAAFREEAAPRPGAALTCRPFPAGRRGEDRGSRSRDALEPVAAARTPRGAPAPWRPGSGSRSTDFRKRR